MKVSVLTKASKGYGYGHLRRSNILSGFLNSEGISSQVIDITLACSEGVDGDVIITDAREIRTDELRKLLKSGRPVVSFDDTETFKPYSVSIMSLPYLNLWGPSPNYEGVDFLVLDPSILKFRTHECEFDVLITFGGEDPNNLTEFVLSKFAEVEEIRNFKVSVLIGILFRNKDSLRQRAERLGIVAIEPDDPTDVINAISKSRLVLTSFGITVYESLVLGKKVVLLNNSEYHELIFRKSGLTDFVESLGVYYEFDSLQFLEVIERILSDEDGFKMFGVNPFENLGRIKSLVERVYSSWDEEKYQCLLLHDVFCTYRGEGISEFFCKDCTKKLVFRF